MRDPNTARSSAGSSAVRMFAVLAMLGGAIALKDGVHSELPYFAIGGVLFAVGLLALRLPALFWTPKRAAQQPEEVDEPVAMAAQHTNRRS